MKPTIKNPKVFISYAWGDSEYQEQVLSFATDLTSVGIDVLFDKWSLKEGHDTHYFMEQCVNDPSVTNVILLLDPIYEQKANSREGGVGEETQIISPEIYNKVTQDKFLPVIFRLNEDGSIPKPHYLKGLLHFNLTDEEKYDDEYQRLVKRLYGIDIYPKPEIGNTPTWVFKEQTVPTKRLFNLQKIRNDNNSVSQKDGLIVVLEDLTNIIVSYSGDYNKPLEYYEQLQVYRDEYLYILKYLHCVKDSHILICDFLESLKNKTKQEMSEMYNCKFTLIHEMFLYTVAFYYKQRDYSSLKYLLNRSYFINDPKRISFSALYHHNELIENAKKKLDNKNYCSGTAKLYTETINPNYCSVFDLCFADEMCYNYIMIKDTDFWFPITYIYDGSGSGSFILRSFSQKLKCSEWAENVSTIFGFKTVEDLKDSLRKLEARVQNVRTRRGYPNAFREAPLITDYIKIDEIGSI